LVVELAHLYGLSLDLRSAWEALELIMPMAEWRLRRL
jgi:hypothetical protein